MKTQQNKDQKRLRLKRKIRMKISGTESRPRLSVYRSNKFIYAQIIDDNAGKTVAQASDVKTAKGTKTLRAEEIGKLVAEAALAKNIKEVVFDRNGFKYTGRVKLLADAARKAGLKF
jgi:large subunit ribosomal protein L18